jgi:hypothetical protein
MFDLYSQRARQVIFLTRLESGARGAEMIGLDDLLAALIVEDQNKIPQTLEMLGETGKFIGLTTHQPFLPPAAATSLLESIQQSLPQSQSIPTSADMAISPAPLHLLAVLLAGSHQRVQALRDAGISEEKVLDVIRREDQL